MLPEVLVANFPLLLQGAERTLYLSAATALFSSAIGLAAAPLRVFGWWPFGAGIHQYLHPVDQEYLAGLDHRALGVDHGRPTDRRADVRPVPDPARCGADLFRDLLLLVQARKIRRAADAPCALKTPPLRRWSSSAASASGSARPRC